jgi:hypothetical protein
VRIVKPIRLVNFQPRIFDQTKKMNEEVTDANLFEQFNFLPQMVQILEKLKKNESIENESHKLEINVKKSLELLETLEGAELTDEQQENLYQELQKELESKT